MMLLMANKTAVIPADKFNRCFIDLDEEIEELMLATTDAVGRRMSQRMPSSQLCAIPSHGTRLIREKQMGSSPNPSLLKEYQDLESLQILLQQTGRVRTSCQETKLPFPFGALPILWMPEPLFWGQCSRNTNAGWRPSSTWGALTLWRVTNLQSLWVISR